MSKPGRTGATPPSVPLSIEGRQADRGQRRCQGGDGDDHAQPQEIPGGDMMPFPPQRDEPQDRGLN